MGIPAAFRWLSNKYPKIISSVIEEQPMTLDDGTTIPVDTTSRNPNGEEFDNLYLDMNGIVHPCSHPEDRPAPKDEEAMMLEVFKYTDRVVNMVRPRKLLMIAVDGVAPRAKMNQQRSRRFRSAQEAKQKEEEKKELLKTLSKDKDATGISQSPETITKAFDSNVITPGTPFMDTLAISLRYWCQYKLNTDPAWAKLKIIISDATIPGEGEHKIMSFVRSQRGSTDYDPNTRHVIYGLDADLIMLGLATHEPHFRVLREDVFFQDRKPRACKLCGQQGHEARNCRGELKEQKEGAEEKTGGGSLKPFIWLHVSVLREYLAAELSVPGLPFRFDVERAIDDWVFMCCFVGNDFLPHLPALEIREHGIDTLTKIWRDNLALMGGYVTQDGHINWERAQRILAELAKQEDSILKRRKEQENRREANAKRRKLQNEGPRTAANRADGSRARQTGYQDPTRGLQLHPIASYPREPPPAITHDMIVNRGHHADANLANKSAANVLKSQLRGEPSFSVLGKRNRSVGEGAGESAVDGPVARTTGPGTLADDSPVDPVRLGEDGYADRYYQQKFNKDPSDVAFRHAVACAYAEGLAWVLLYYLQGCPSWDWFYPYHYAPFAADFRDLAGTKFTFDKGYISKPFEQLMSVLPAASRHSLPDVFHELMTSKDSDIIDFYPEEFEIDLNGKKMAWQGVVLLPFIDMPRLLGAVQRLYPQLSPEDALRNSTGRDVLLFADSHESLYNEVSTRFYSKRQGASKFKVGAATSDGLIGKLEKRDDYVPHGMLRYPLKRHAMPDLDYDRSMSVYYEMPASHLAHKSMLLRGAQLPPPVLTRSDVETIGGRATRHGRNYGGAPLDRVDAWRGQANRPQGRGQSPPYFASSRGEAPNIPPKAYRGSGWTQ
ncbi:5'-3' exoribonuclease 2 [Ophiocordyceps camponoti-floridani]|uniref:5'-3' exoribonuclease n=1 Tax=Ophiocordyceps camponoti-floridani TaxID=2030778 RepID=A0A8H4VEY2_9HYPO|nr:5'-3' exoribonuclease 2 [Ophiocordyceps camponoti-floridani]